MEQIWTTKEDLEKKLTKVGPSDQPFKEEFCIDTIVQLENGLRAEQDHATELTRVSKKQMGSAYILMSLVRKI